jgi:uncharacterized protein
VHFFILCWDKPGRSVLREETCPAHLAYLPAHMHDMLLGSPLETKDGAIVGTVFLIDMANQAAAAEFTADEPSHRAGFFESVIRPGE